MTAGGTDYSSLKSQNCSVIHGPWQQSLFQTPRFVFSSVWIFNEIQERAPSMQIGVHSRSSAISSRQWCKLCITKGIVATKRSAGACFSIWEKGAGEVHQEDKEAVLPVVRSAWDMDHLGIWGGWQMHMTPGDHRRRKRQIQGLLDTAEITRPSASPKIRVF